MICRKRLQKSRYCTESLRISKIISYFAPRISRKSNRATSPDFDRCSSDGFPETNQTKHEKQVQRPDRTDVRFPSGRIFGRGQRAESVRHSAHGDHQAVRHTVEGHLPAEDLLADRTCQAHVQRGHGEGRLQGRLQLLLLHQIEPLLLRARRGAQKRHPPRNLVGLRHPHHQRPLRRRDHRQGPLHHLQRFQTSSVRGEYRAAGRRRIRKHHPRDRQQGGGRTAGRRDREKVQGGHPHRLRGGAEIRFLHLSSGHPLQRHRRLLQAQDQDQQEVPVEDAPLLHQHGHQGHGLLLERVASASTSTAS